MDNENNHNQTEKMERWASEFKKQIAWRKHWAFYINARLNWRFAKLEILNVGTIQQYKITFKKKILLKHGTFQLEENIDAGGQTAGKIARSVSGCHDTNNRGGLLFNRMLRSCSNLNFKQKKMYFVELNNILTCWYDLLAVVNHTMEYYELFIQKKNRIGKIVKCHSVLTMTTKNIVQNNI